MARGLWRWWETKDGADVWWARVELGPGQWSDLEPSEYESQGVQPSFWNLPLKEDHFAATMRDPIADEDDRLNREFVYPGVIAVILAGTVLFVVFVVGYAVLVNLNLIR